MLVGLEGVLLVVRGELKGKVAECEDGEDIIRDAQCRRLLEGGNICGNAEKEQDDVLYEGYDMPVDI